MRLLLVLAVLMLPVPAVADPASAKAWICARSPALAMCRAVEQRPPGLMPEEEPIEYLPLPVLVPPLASPSVSVPNKPMPEAVPVHQSVPAATPAKARPKPQVIERRKPMAPKTRPAFCSQIDMGVRMLGVSGMRQAAIARGYSNSQIASAQRACGY